MASVNLRLPEELQRFVNEQVEVGEFDGAGAYIEALIARAKKGKRSLSVIDRRA